MEKIRKIVLWMLTGFVVVCTLSCITDASIYVPDGTVELKVGEKLPDFFILMHNKTPLSTSDLRGRCSVIIFFNTDCPDCQRELPVIQKVYDAYGSKLRFVGISRKEADAHVQKYWEEHGFSLPYSAQEDAHIYHMFAKSGIPRVYISDENLVIKAIFTDDPMATEEELKREIQRVLKE